MRCLVTGSEGLVGKATMQVFKDAGYEVRGIDARLRTKMLIENEDVMQPRWEDIRNESFIESLFKAGDFDVIVHAAAQPSHDYSKDHVLEDFDINARGTVILLEATRKYCPDAVFIYVSTDKVYGERMSLPLRETETRYEAMVYETGFNENWGLDFAGARSPFGCSKAAGDMYVQEYGNYFGMNTGIFRPGCITGKNHEGAELHGFLAHLAKCIRTGATYKIFGNGKNVRDQIHADDLATAFLEFATFPRRAAVYNMGGGPERAVSVLEAINLIQNETQKVCAFEFHEARHGDRLYDVHDVRKFRTDYPNWKYKYSLQDIIQDVCAKEL